MRVKMSYVSLFAELIGQSQTHAAGYARRRLRAGACLEIVEAPRNFPGHRLYVRKPHRISQVTVYIVQNVRKPHEISQVTVYIVQA